jgi:voltage-gated potassium channel
MKKRIDELEDHFIIAGIGNTGEYVLDEMVHSQRDCLVIDSNHDRLEDVHEEHDIDFPYIVGDATDDSVLIEAGVERADSLVCSLGSDRDNLFVTISARSLNDDLRIVTRGYQPESEQKFKMAGASSVIYTNVLGGLRMAAEAIRPQVTTFLDLMMQDHGHYRRVEELNIPHDSPLVGKEIRNAGIRENTDALIIAVYEESNDEYIFNPGPTYQLTGDTKLIVLTLIEDLERLESMIQG